MKKKKENKDTGKKLDFWQKGVILGVFIIVIFFFIFNFFIQERINMDLFNFLLLISFYLLLLFIYVVLGVGIFILAERFIKSEKSKKKVLLIVLLLAFVLFLSTIFWPREFSTAPKRTMAGDTDVKCICFGHSSFLRDIENSKSYICYGFPVCNEIKSEMMYDRFVIVAMD